MSELFRGFVVKDWEGADFNYTRYRKLNKILVPKAILFMQNVRNIETSPIMVLRNEEKE